MFSTTSVQRPTKVFAVAALLFLTATIALHVAWTRISALMVLRWFVDETAIPVEVRSANWDVRLGELLRGKIRSLHLDVYYQPLGTEVSIDTPVAYSHTGAHWTIGLAPTLTIGAFPPASGTMNLQLDVKRKGSKVDAQGASVDLHLHETRPLHLANKDGVMSAEKWNLDGWVQWSGEWSSELEFIAKKFRLEKTGRGASLTADKIKIHADTSWPQHSPLPFDVDGKVSATELTYLTPSLLAHEPRVDLDATFRFDGKRFTSVDLSVDKPFKLAAQGEFGNGTAKGAFTLRGSLEDLFTERAASWLQAQAPLLRRAKAKGSLELKGNLSLKQDGNFSANALLQLKASVVEFPTRDLYLDQIALKLPLAYPHDPDWGELSLKIAEFHSVKLKNLWLATRLSKSGVDITTEDDAGQDRPLHQLVWGGAIDIEELYARIGFDSDREFTAKISGGPFKIPEIQKDLCFLPGQPLNGTLAFHYPRVVEDRDSIRLIGDTNLSMLGGTAHLGDLSLSFSERSPRLRFTADWNDLDFGSIGEWSGFGDMRGSLHGTLKNAVLALTPLGPMPLSYDLALRGTGRGGNKMSFYGRSMNNVMAAVGIPQDGLPWPARTLFGVTQMFRNWLPAKADVLGLKAKTADGWTELSTFDPPGDASGWCDPEKRYLLCGDGFTIPLNTHGVYPVMIKTDAFHRWLAGFSNYMKQVSKHEKNEQQQCTPLW